MPEPASRRFTIADGMALVAATGVGLALARAYSDAFHGIPFHPSPSSWRTTDYLRTTSSCMVACWMLTILGLRLRRPRPRLRRLARNPGFAASCALAAGLAVGMIEAIPRAIGGPRDLMPGPFERVSGLMIWGGRTVLGAWILLAVFRLWRPERSWIDRLGRVLGWSWIAWDAFSLLPRRAQEFLVPALL